MIATNLPASPDINKSNSQVKNLFKNKFENIVFLHINSIQISEFMTRGQSLDEEHIKNLMAVMQKEGYLPESSIWVNAITGPHRTVMQYRLVAGRHRLEACRRLGIDQIPALIFYDLTDEEECMADRVSNEKDRRHKKVTAIEEARHCFFLHQKGWSLRKIARAKGISKSAVGRKLQIAKLPQKVQEILQENTRDIFVTVPRGTPEISERQLQNICKLKAEPHQVMLCHKLLGNEPAPTDNTEQTVNKTITTPELKRMVRELKLLENQGEIAEEALQYFRDEKIPNIDSIKITEEVTTKDIITSAAEEAWRNIMKGVSSDHFDRREKKGMRFGTVPLWLRHCKDAANLPISSFHLLLEIVGCDLRYTPEKDKYFFIKQGKSYKNTEQYLAAIAGVKELTLIKKLLPSLSEYVDYRKAGDILKFRVKWNKFFELYKRTANHIPFHDGGLDEIPENETEKVFPTPYHCIIIENGQVKQTPPAEEKDISVTEPDLEIPAIKSVLPALQPTIKENIPMFQEQKQSEEQSIQELTPKETVNNRLLADAEQPDNANEEYILSEHSVAQTLKKLGMAPKQVTLCVSPINIENTQNILKYINEMKPSERANIKSLPAYIFGMIKNKNFKPPENFVTHQAEEEKTQKRETAEEVGSAVLDGYRTGMIRFFCPKPDVRLPLSDVPNMSSFLYCRGNREIRAGSFGEWADLRFFC